MAPSRKGGDWTAARLLPRGHRPQPDCACGNGAATLADTHTDAEPEFSTLGLLIGIDVDDIKVGDILTTGQDIEIAGTWYCTAPGYGVRDIDRAMIEAPIAQLRQHALYGDDARADGEH